MSYLDRLMAQTGIDLAPTAARVEPASASPIVEIDVRQIGPQPMTTPAEPAPRAPPTAAPVNRSVADHTPRPAPIERIEPAIVHTALAPDLMPRQALPPRAREPAIPEIVIERRVESPEKPAPRVVHQTTGEALAPPQPVSVLQAKLAPKKEAQRETREPAQARRQPTFIEIRNWVASTPAADEAPAETHATQADAPRPSPLERATVTREASLLPRAEPDRVRVPEAPQVELSIGTMQLIVEAPPTPAPPVRPQPPASRADAAAPSWSRLSRRYIRP